MIDLSFFLCYREPLTSPSKYTGFSSLVLTFLLEAQFERTPSSLPNVFDETVPDVFLLGVTTDIFQNHRCSVNSRADVLSFFFLDKPLGRALSPVFFLFSIGFLIGLLIPHTRNL